MSWADRSDPGCWMTIQVRMSRRFRGLPGCTKTLRLSLLARISNEDLSDGVAHVHPVLQAMLPLLAYAPMRLWQGRGPTLCRRGAVCQTPRLFFRLVAVLYVFSAIPNDCARTSLQCHARGAGKYGPHGVAKTCVKCKTTHYIARRSALFLLELLVERRRIELPTFALRTRRSPS